MMSKCVRLWSNNKSTVEAFHDCITKFYGYLSVPNMTS